MKVKVCGMKHSQNIEALGKLSVHFMGLIFYAKSPRFAGSLAEEELLRLLPEHIRKVGVFVNADVDEIETAARQYQLHYIQFHGSESLELIREVKSRLPRIKTIKAFNVAQVEDLDATFSYAGQVDYFLFDTKTEQHGGSGKKFDWAILQAYCGETPFFLSGGISLEDAEELRLLHHPKLFALDINSKFEMEPGLKDIQRIEKFIKQIQS